jgi:DNA-binding PadR family transcriptional regulator
MSRTNDISPQPALLGLLMLQPRHGYELYQEFQRELGRVWRVGRSQLYSQLKQLESAGLVAGETVPQDNRPPRKVYTLTEGGRQAFLDWVQEPTPYLRDIRVEFLARLYFYRALSLPGLDVFVAEQKAVCRERAGELGARAAGMDDSYRRLVIEFRQGQLEAVLRWLDRCVDLLATGQD